MTLFRLGLAGLAALSLSVACVTSASAERRLAVGAAGGFALPEGAQMRPVYTLPRGTRWDPVDAGPGYSFREPIYTTPPGYRYVYVRGYQIVRPRALAKTASVKPAKAVPVRAKERVRACVTDLGLGRYEVCP